MLHAEYGAMPLALPAGAVVLALATLFARRLAGSLRVPTWLGWLYLVAIGGFAVVTLTPAGGSFVGGWPSGHLDHLVRSMHPSLPRREDLTSLNEVSLNVAAGVPLGLFSLLTAIRARRATPLLTVLVPVACESLQALFPQLDRVGFVLGDVINNLIGFLLGLVLALALIALAKRVTR